MKKINSFAKIGISIIFLFLILSYSGNAANRINVLLNWVRGPTGVSVDSDNDGFLDAGSVSDVWVNASGDTMTGTLIGLNLNMTYGNFSQDVIILGNVGIGKTSPNFKLDVGGRINASALNVTGTVEATTFIGDASLMSGLITARPWNASGTNVYLNDSTASVGIGTLTPLSKLHINDSSAEGALRVTNASGSVIFFVNGSSGNVGIGTANPGTKLDVNGNISSSGNISIVTNNKFCMNGPTCTKYIYYNGSDVVIVD